MIWRIVYVVILQRPLPVGEVRGQLSHLLRPGGREHEGLPPTGHSLQDGADLGLEAHVEHPVGLVENDVENLRKRTLMIQKYFYRAINWQIFLPAKGRSGSSRGSRLAGPASPPGSTRPTGSRGAGRVSARHRKRTRCGSRRLQTCPLRPESAWPILGSGPARESKNPRVSETS